MKDFPCKDGNLAKEELELLARSLGYNSDVFFNGFNEEQKIRQSIKFDDLKFLLEGTVFYPLLNKTYNQHDGSYNIKVVSKAIELLMHRHLSFSSLRLARISFQAYEHTDNAGLQEHYILRALRLSEKTLAPLKLQQMLRHMNRLVPDRLMLYEYFDVVASAECLADVAREIPKKKEVHPITDNRNLFYLCDFEEELSTFDQRCYRYLDDHFRDTLKIIPVDNLSNNEYRHNNKEKKEWVKPPLANTAIRREAVSRNRLQSRQLSEYLDNSHTLVKQCKCGGPCDCNLNGALWPSNKEKKPVVISNCGGERKTETQTVQRDRTYPLIITDSEIEETVQNLHNVRWELATKSHQRRKVEFRKRSDI